MTTSPTSVSAEAKELAGTILSGAADTIEVATELGVELPIIGPILKAIIAVREKLKKVQNNQGKLEALHDRCLRITAEVVVKCTAEFPELDVARLEKLVQGVDNFINDCLQESGGIAMLKPAEVERKISGMHEMINQLMIDMGLAGIADIRGNVNQLLAQSESRAEKQNEILENIRKISERLRVPPPTAKLASVPKGTLVHKPWHVERRRVMATVLEALTREGGPPLVGLVGGGGSGKTTAASEIVRSDETRFAFADGIVWLTVNDGAKERLPSLMRRLARRVYEVVGGSVGRPPAPSDDGAAYIKRFVGRGHGGEGSKCLVVADNVWEEEVISKLLETGMSVLVSTRREELVTAAQGEAVRVDELAKDDAMLLLTRAAELSEGEHLPDAAVDLVELCGRVAMDLAFVGRWSTVRQRRDPDAWSKAAGRVRAEMDKIGCDPGAETGEDAHVTRRKAILRAGFDELAAVSEDKRVPRLYLALAVMPDGHEFTVKDAAVLRFDAPSPADEASVRGVLGVLERWTIVQVTDGTYQMLDAHATFAREKLMDRNDVREPAVTRWVAQISSLEALQSFESYVLQGLWRAVEEVGGEGWDTIRPYAKELAAMHESDPSFRESLYAVADFQEVQEDWEGASATWRQLLDVEDTELGSDHPIRLGTYAKLARCADRLGDEDQAAEWREQESNVLPSALARMRLQADAGDFEQEEDSRGLFALTAKRGELSPADRPAVEEMLKRCLSIFEAKLGPDDVQVAYTLRKLGRWVRDSWRLEEAEELLRRCLEIMDTNPEVDEVLVAYTLNELGVCLQEAGQLHEAADLLRRSLGIKKDKLGADHVQVAYTLHYLGITLRKAGQLEEAEEALKHCLEIREAKLGLHHVKVSITLLELGICAREAGRLDEAQEVLSRCLSIKEDNPDTDDTSPARTVNLLGVTMREAGRLKESEVLLKRCLDIVESKLGKVSDTTNKQLTDRQVTWLEKACDHLKRYLAIGEAELGCKREGADKMLQELRVCLRQARK
eukprot:g10885.t1